MDKVGEEIVNEIAEIINQHQIDDKPKKKKHLIKTAAAIGGALILTITITMQSDSFKKNQTAYANELLNIKKTSHVTKRYTTELDLPHYLEEVDSMTAGPD